jgi:thiamine biosynthesis lipoprotein
MLGLRKPLMRSKFNTLLLVAILVTACAPKAQPPAIRSVEKSAPSMGTELRLRAWTADESGAIAAFDAVFKEFERIEALMSNWREGSEIQQLNAAAGKSPVPIGPEIRSVLRTARQISEWTEGKFDVTWGAMSGLWKFDYQDKDGSIPDPTEVARRRKLIDYRELEVNEEAGTVLLRREGMVAHLGGIGKGYAVDRARDMLRERGFQDFMIQFGGDMYVSGKSGDRPWKLGIQDPRGTPEQIFASVELSDSTFSTSGDYERFFIKDGRRYHHILDPATGEPSQGSRSVTIMASSAAVADGLSTGVFLLGPEAGMALIERLPDVEGVIVGSDNKVRVSSGLEGRLMLVASPTDAP